MILGKNFFKALADFLQNQEEIYEWVSENLSQNYAFDPKEIINIHVGTKDSQHYVGDEREDIVDYSYSDGPVWVDLQNGVGVMGFASGDTYSNIEHVVGSDFDDILAGNSKANQLYGGKGRDTLAGGEGADMLDGGDGIDVADYSTHNHGVTVNLSTGEGKGGHAEGDILKNIENIKGSSGSDILTGDSLANTILGDGGDDLIEGGGGADVLDGGSGFFNTVSYSQSNAGVTIDLKNGTGERGHAQGDELSNFNNVIGSDHGDKIIGDDVSNVILGGKGNDDLFGGGSGDIFQAEEGNDNIDGGSGEDSIQFSGKISNYLISKYDENTLRFEHRNGNSIDVDGIDHVTNVEKFGFADGTFEEADLLARLPEYGGSYRVINGGSEKTDKLEGTGGRDIMFTFGGNDILFGSVGGDILDGGDGIDTASYFFSDRGVEVSLIQGAVGVSGHAKGDRLIDIENITGSVQGDDTLTGNWKDNILNGESGDDTLDGGGGQDTLFGGSGSDTILAGRGNDIIDGGRNNSGIFSSSIEAENDTLVFSGAFSEYTITENRADEFVFEHLDNSLAGTGRDTVRNVESFQFADDTISLEELRSRIEDGGATGSFDSGTSIADVWGFEPGLGIKSADPEPEGLVIAPLSDESAWIPIEQEWGFWTA